ncbi:hypothetical protein R9C00_13025 [Flammeovirgaceae bacterium SG7u.111]|nr:hypothetical protein [Flammeovirgaceae bacterium SG7u.132]WPO38378.1 hypothetical protein R9C00_13025 [Flammeovirgaceae bacterium SG7u.111]
MYGIDKGMVPKQTKTHEELTKEHQSALVNKDTLAIVKCLIDLAQIERYRGDYDLAFDRLWDALLIAEKQQLDNQLITIYRGLGILYDIYEKDSLALQHLYTSLSLSKELAIDKPYTKHQVVSSYFSIATFWRDRKNYEEALVYLDSCTIIFDPPRILPYILADRGFCNLQLENLAEAEKLLFRAQHHLVNMNAPYVVANLSFIGDLKKEQFQYDSALVYYNKSLQLMDERNVHLEFKPDLLEKISEIYTIKGECLKAVSSMKESKKSFEQLFSTSSKSSQRLFEIKNKYKAEITENQKLIERQESLIEQKNEELFRLFLLFGLTLIIFISVYLLYYQRNKIKKLSLVGELDRAKNKAVLEIKSKELTSYAIKMIEMEDAVNAILDVVKKSHPENYQLLKKKYAKGTNNSWEEFNRRFVEVNNDFYSTLCKKHPNLSSTELKHCALIKLNLNSHEMAKILNISLQSVHTSRYRIRKKMGLPSNSSLTIYIGSI